MPALEKKDALLVPGDAVSFDQQGEYVLVVNDKNIVERRGVKTGSQVGSMLASTLLAIPFVSVFYIVMENFSEWWRERKAIANARSKVPVPKTGLKSD